MSETLIELRQRNKNTVVKQNGDYNVTLGSPLKVEQGDILQVKQAFIDTVSREQGKILIPHGVDEINFTFGIYLQDQDSTRDTAANLKTYFTDTPLPTPSGKNFILTSESPNPNGAGGVHIITFNKIVLTDDVENNRFVRDRYMKGRYKYKDVNGNEKPFHFDIRSKVWDSKLPQDGSPTEGYPVTLDANFDWHSAPPFNFPCQRDAYGPNKPLTYDDKADGKKNEHDGKFKLSGPLGIENINTNAIYEPWLFTATCPVNEGTAYTPFQFAQHLTRNLTFGASADGTIPANSITPNSILQDYVSIKARGKSQDGSNPNTHPIWCSSDGLHALRFNDGVPNLLLGSSNFDFGFDLETNLFSLDKIHSPIYTGNLEGVVPMDINGTRFMLNKVGGIFITHCDLDGLLTKQMNLPPSMFAKQTGNISGNIGALNNVTVPTFSLFRDGVNLTGNAVYLDSLITKGSNPANNQDTFDVVPSFSGSSASYATDKGITSDEVTNIQALYPIGEDDSQDPNSDVGYYQIEINSNFNFNKISNSKNSSKIGAIVNKYYSTNNYTISDSSMSTVYVHNEPEPMLLTAFNVRLLNPDGQPVDPVSLQDDNTVFLALQKNKPE